MADEKDPKQIPVLKWFGIEYVPPRWAYTSIAAVLVAFLTAFLWLKIVQPYIDSRGDLAHRAEDMEHYQKHLMEPRLFEQTFFESAVVGKLIVGYYASDHCLMVVRTQAGGNGGEVAHFIKETVYYGSPSKREAAKAAVPPAALPFLAAIATASSAPPAQPVQQRTPCLNPHPGNNFKWWYGDKRGAWVEVWREWPDGCKHYQMYNTINGAWDMRNGVPVINWVHCVH